MRFEASKRVRKMVSQLATTAHERELARMLKELARLIERWERGEVGTWEVNDAIGNFMRGQHRRRIDGLYTARHIEHMAVAQAVLRGILAPEEVPQEAAIALEDAMEFYKRGLADGSVSFDDEED